MIMRRAQSSLEFLVLVAAVLFFFLIFALDIQSDLAQKTRENRAETVKDIAATVKNEINLAVHASEGYQREFELPSNIVNQPYNVSIVDDLVYVVTEDGKAAVAVPVPDVEGDVRIGTNTIRKKDGEVHINN